MALKPVTKSQIVAKLNLKPNPEGGYYSETFRDSSIILSKSRLPPQYKVDRAVSTSIYFLLSSGCASRLHRIPCAETWHFYMGEPITVKSDGLLCVAICLQWGTLPFHNSTFSVLELNEKDGSAKLTSLGPDIVNENQLLQYVVPPGVWFGAFPTKDIDISADWTLIKKAARDSELHFSLVGCTCAPAFQFEDFELAQRSELISRFPEYSSLISLLTFSE